MLNDQDRERASERSVGERQAGTDVRNLIRDVQVVARCPSARHLHHPRRAVKTRHFVTAPCERSRVRTGPATEIGDWSWRLNDRSELVRRAFDKLEVFGFI